MGQRVPDCDRERRREPAASARAPREEKAAERRGEGERGGGDAEGGLVGRDQAAAREGEAGEEQLSSLQSRIKVLNKNRKR